MSTEKLNEVTEFLLNVYSKKRIDCANIVIAQSEGDEDTIKKYLHETIHTIKSFLIDME